MFFFKKPTDLPTGADALPGRDEAIPTSATHAVNGNDLAGVPEGMKEAFFAMGCFWGAERMFWMTPGVHATQVGYQGGRTLNPTYREVCSGQTGHTEVVRVVYDPATVSYEDLLKVFWEGHDPTQGMRQGNDVGTQYRSAVYTTSDAQLEAAKASKAMFEDRLKAADYGPITTEIAPAAPFYAAEGEHQQYLHKNPGGYCGLGGTGVSCPVGVAV